MKMAFIFILIGYGTKVGFAPLHTWLPDAYSQSPTPVSALLSGALVNCVLYGLFRILNIASASLGAGFVQQFLTCFGLLSLIIAIPFILIQSDLKRLFAYSSVENAGIIAFALGIGGKWGIMGGLLQLVNHALAKAGLFLTAGEITELYQGKRLHKIKGLFTLAPGLGIIFFVYFLIISGTPPFPVFFSKMTIIYAGLQHGNFFSALIFILALFVIFCGLLFHCGNLGLGTPPHQKTGPVRNRWAQAVLILPIIILTIISFYQPPFWRILTNQAVQIIGGSVQ
jgi:hydrogenase-4 component F